MDNLEREYNKSLIHYKAARRKVMAVIENLEELLEVRYDRDIINSIKTRIKEFDSAIEKCERKGYTEIENFGIDVIKENLLDIAGIRVITVYRSDVYVIYEAIKQTDLIISKVNDYIEHPKESGYRSLHIIFSVPVSTDNGTILVPVELQLRDIIMNTWATIDHDFRYKNENPDPEAVALLQDMSLAMRKHDDEAERIRAKKPAT